MRENQPSTGSPRPAADDLQQIAGIGTALAARLTEAGVLRYRDLASRTPEQLAAMARLPAGKITSQDWIGQALRLAGDARVEPDDQQKYATFHVELLIDADGTVRRTKTRHYQTDTEDSWPGWDDKQLIAVIRRKAALDAPAPAAAPASVPAPASVLAPAEPQPAQAPLIQVDGPCPAGEGSRGTFRLAGQPTAVRMTLQVGPIDGADAGKVDFTAEVAARPVGNGNRHPVAVASGAITAGQPVNLELAGPALPPGTHRLEAAIAIYAHLHEPAARPLYRRRILGDLVYIAGRRAQQARPRSPVAQSATLSLRH
jgi:Helix-hairpin-helix domain